jgi:hypothetical protein
MNAVHRAITSGLRLRGIDASTGQEEGDCEILWILKKNARRF